MLFTETASNHQSTFIPDGVKPRVLCFGDSLTWGDDPALPGHRLPTRWPVVLQDALGPGYTVIEEGQCGRNIATNDPAEGEKNGLLYIRPCLESHSPLDLVIIMLGTNDLARKFSYSLQDIAWEMERLLQKVMMHRQFSSTTRYDILLISPPPLNDGLLTSWLGDLFEFENGIRKSRELSKWYRELAERYETGFIDAGLHCKSSAVDGVHLDEENQRKLGKAVADYVRGIR